jgi:hypothetical protein
MLEARTTTGLELPPLRVVPFLLTERREHSSLGSARMHSRPPLVPQNFQSILAQLHRGSPLAGYFADLHLEPQHPSRIVVKLATFNKVVEIGTQAVDLEAGDKAGRTVGMRSDIAGQAAA